MDRADRSERLDTAFVRSMLERMRPDKSDLTLIGVRPYNSAPPVLSLLDCVLDERGNVPVDTLPDQSHSYAAAFTGSLTPDELQGYMGKVNEIKVLGGVGTEVPYLRIPSNPNAPISVGTMDPVQSVETLLPGGNY